MTPTPEQSAILDRPPAALGAGRFHGNFVVGSGQAASGSGERYSCLSCLSTRGRFLSVLKRGTRETGGESVGIFYTSFRW